MSSADPNAQQANGVGAGTGGLTPADANFTTADGQEVHVGPDQPTASDTGGLTPANADHSATASAGGGTPDGYSTPGGAIDRPVQDDVVGNALAGGVATLGLGGLWAGAEGLINGGIEGLVTGVEEKLAVDAPVELAHVALESGSALIEDQHESAGAGQQADSHGTGGLNPTDQPAQHDTGVATPADANYSTTDGHEVNAGGTASADASHANAADNSAMDGQP